MEGGAEMKRVLERNRELLVRNIIPGEELLSRLHAFSILTDTMLREVKECTGQENKNSKLLELLLLRGSKVMTKFCDSLHLSGHTYLAEMLREEVEGNPLESVDLDEVLRRCPRVSRAVHTVGEEDRDSFRSLVNDKMREMTVKQIWQRTSRDKTRAMDAKQRQLEDTWKFSEVLKDKEVAIRSLKDELNKAHKEVDRKARALESLERKLERQKENQSSALDTQLKTAAASDSTLRRLEERGRETETGLQELLKVMLRSLHTPTFKYRDTSFTTLHKVKDVLDVMVEKVEDVVWLQKKYYAMKEEKETLVKVMAGKDATDTDLVKIFKGYEVRHHTKLEETEHKMQVLENALEVTKKALAAKDKALLLNSMKGRHEGTKNHVTVGDNEKKKQAPVEVKITCNKHVQTIEVSSEDKGKNNDITNLLLLKEIEKLRSQILSQESVTQETTKNNDLSKSTVSDGKVNRVKEAELKKQVQKLESDMRMKNAQIVKLKDVGNKLQKALRARTQQVGALEQEMERVTARMTVEDSASVRKKKKLIMSRNRVIETDIEVEDLEDREDKVAKDLIPRETHRARGQVPENHLPSLPSVSEQLVVYNHHRHPSTVQGFDLAEPPPPPEPDIQAWRRIMGVYALDNQSPEGASRTSRRSVGVSFPPLSDPFPRLHLRPKDRHVSIPAHKQGNSTLTLEQTTGSMKLKVTEAGTESIVKEQSSPRSRTVVTITKGPTKFMKHETALKVNASYDSGSPILKRS